MDCQWGDAAQHRWARNEGVRAVYVVRHSPPDAVPFTSNSASYTHDAFGRPLVVTGPDGAVTASVTYHPLKTDVLDGDQVPGGTHAGSYTESVTDGRGIPMSATKYLVNGPVDQITTSVSRYATGQIYTLTQTHTAGPETYSRGMAYDSLGRLVANFEPNTSNYGPAVGGVSPLNEWRYAYDDAGDLVGTSDSRGCGENLAYDGLGRLINEDYSPCNSGQAAYTQGYETFYTYDTPVLPAPTPGDYAGS